MADSARSNKISVLPDPSSESGVSAVSAANASALSPFHSSTKLTASDRSGTTRWVRSFAALSTSDKLFSVRAHLREQACTASSKLSCETKSLDGVAAAGAGVRRADLVERRPELIVSLAPAGAINACTQVRTRCGCCASSHDVSETVAALKTRFDWVGILSHFRTVSTSIGLLLRRFPLFRTTSARNGRIQVGHRSLRRTVAVDTGGRESHIHGVEYAIPLWTDLAGTSMARQHIALAPRSASSDLPRGCGEGRWYRHSITSHIVEVADIAIRHPPL